jgi:signal transduction histidine kinase
LNIDAPRGVPAQAIRWMTLFWVIVVSSVIGFILGLMDDGPRPFYYNIVISNAFGISIFVVTNALMYLSKDRIAILPALLIAAPLGVLIGAKVATLFGAYDLVGRWIHDPARQWKSIVLSSVLVISTSAFFFNLVRNAEFRLDLERERRRGAEASKAQAVAQLGLLQAQIEPHFLFNTLAHIQSAIDQEPAVGKRMLEHLIFYLRGTLTRTRSASYTVGEEQGLIDALLAIAQIRMGSRLRYAVQLPPSVRDAHLPPLLLQPLVENAIKHGIEPSLDGGEIQVTGAVDGDALVLRVADTGVGITLGNPEGVGLSNVRERLAALYGEQGRLSLERNTPRGTIAELRVPRSLET